MPSLRVTKNEREICAAGSDRAWMLSAHLWGTIWGPEAATLDVTGGSTPDPSGKSDFLIWTMLSPILRGDRLGFRFEASSQSRPTPEIFHPKSDAPSSSYLNEPERRSSQDVALNERLIWTVFPPNDALPVVGSPSLQRQHVTLNLLWNNHSAQSDSVIRMHFYRVSLDEIRNRSGGETLLKAKFPIGSGVAVTLA